MKYYFYSCLRFKCFTILIREKKNLRVNSWLSSVNYRGNKKEDTSHKKHNKLIFYLFNNKYTFQFLGLNWSKVQEYIVLWSRQLRSNNYNIYKFLHRKWSILRYFLLFVTSSSSVNKIGINFCWVNSLQYIFITTSCWQKTIYLNCTHHCIHSLQFKSFGLCVYIIYIHFYTVYIYIYNARRLLCVSQSGLGAEVGRHHEPAVAEMTGQVGPHLVEISVADGALGPRAQQQVGNHTGPSVRLLFRQPIAKDQVT